MLLLMSVNFLFNKEDRILMCCGVW